MSDDDALTQTRIDVAEMKGMLKQALHDHAQRLATVESGHSDLQILLHDKAMQLARQDERIKDLEDDNTARLGRITAVIGTVLAILAGLLSIYALAAPVPL